MSRQIAFLSVLTGMFLSSHAFAAMTLEAQVSEDNWINNRITGQANRTQDLEPMMDVIPALPSRWHIAILPLQNIAEAGMSNWDGSGCKKKGRYSQCSARIHVTSTFR
jgi:hypothetical protein